MTIRQVTSMEAANLPLRKEPSREGELRVIEIEDFDLTPCGGTHAKSTGEVGVIAVRSWERAKGLARIQFMAGIRVLADYRKANRTARDVAALFSAGREDSPVLVGQMVGENRKLRRRVSELEQVACRVEAEDLLRGSSPTVREGVESASDGDRVDREAVTDSSRGLSAQRDTRYRTGSGPGSPSGQPAWGGGCDRIIGSTLSDSDSRPRIIAKIFDDRDADSLKYLALALIAHANTVALLGSRDGDTARLVFARSSDADGDMNSLMREACSIIGGRGGGKADMAQGGGKNVARLVDAIESATFLLGARAPSPAP
jgi:alanyl-tRNA synthetase